MPKRNAAQRTGRRGESHVEELIDQHPRWLARRQNEDFGIDLEAELADMVEDAQELRGQIIKLQVKARSRLRRADGHVLISVERDWIDYACAFRVPVILVAMQRDTRRCWCMWVQEWALVNEEMLANSNAHSVTIRIPVAHRLETGLDHALPAIAEGRAPSAMVLALRGVLEVASGWENRAIAQGVVETLGGTAFPSRDWTIRKIVDQLTELGPNPAFWRAQQYLPILLAVIEKAGDTLTREQVVRIVQRGEVHSRTGINALSTLYDDWSEHAASLGLPAAFTEAGLDAAAWYAAMRERFPGKKMFGLFLLELPDGDLVHEGAALRIDADLREYLMMKWPNRGDSMLLDCLFWPGLAEEQGNGS